MAFSNLQYTQSLLQQFHEIGVRVVIDDFGVGVTSLNDLTKLTVKGLKLHKALIKDISSNRNAAAIIHALVSMAKYLNLSVAAVGVDQSDKLNILKSLGCDLIQGYLMAPPLAVEEATLKLQGMVNASMIPTSQLIHS
jgi:EAL domain-containing protein (putative c-di-GMP-specific phosphodiesterase class I)